MLTQNLTKENKSKKGCIVKLRNIQRESDLNNLWSSRASKLKGFNDFAAAHTRAAYAGLDGDGWDASRKYIRGLIGSPLDTGEGGAKQQRHWRGRGATETRAGSAVKTPRLLLVSDRPYL